MAPRKTGMLEKRIIVTGPTGSGKTSVIAQYIQGFVANPEPTTEEVMHSRNFDVTIGSSKVKLQMQIFDAPARQMRQNPSADIVLLVFSIGGPRSSTDQIQALYDTAKLHFGALTHIYLVCNSWDAFDEKTAEKECKNL